MEWIAVAVIGLAVGFLGGLFGKGGSALATPLLAAIGIPPALAIAAPLPATIPSTLAASTAYAGRQLVDRDVVRWSIAIGLPATIAGALASGRVDAGALVRITDVLVTVVGLRILSSTSTSVDDAAAARPAGYRTRVVVVAAVVGLAAGLLANSGGFLLAPLYLTVLRLPVKRALATSLLVSAALAVPGTIVHGALGHLDLRLVLVFAAAAVPLARLGANVAVRVDAHRLERAYGAGLTVLGVAFLANWV